MKRIIRAVAFVCALIFVCSVIWVVLFMVRAFFPSITVKITRGKTYANLVTLPGDNRSAALAADTKHLPGSGEAWARSSPAEFSWQSQYDFRNSDGHPDLLFIRVFEQYQGEDERFYGDTDFALDLSGKVARRASEQEWNSALGYAYDGDGGYYRSHWFETGRVSFPDNDVAFDGKRYAWIGPSMRSVQISPSGKRIVLSSSSYFNGSAWWIFPWPRALTYFLDVYDATSGIHLVSAHGEMNEYQIAVVSQERWFTDRYLIMPQSRGHEKLLLFDFGPQ
jgi:hypothetical protein